MAHRFNILRPRSRDDRLKSLMRRMKLAAARMVVPPAPANA